MADLMSTLLSGMLGGSSTTTLAKKTGASEDQVKTIVSAALPVLLQSMANNSKDEAGAKSLAGALSQHAENKESAQEQIEHADVEDGGKILGHLLGNNKTAVEKNIAKTTGLEQNQVATLLATLAPVLLSQMGKQTKAKESNALDLGGILSSLVSGGGGQSSGDLLGSVVGAVLSGSKDSKSGKKSTSKNDDLLSGLMGLLTGK